MNQLNVSLQQSILRLATGNWSQRRIARELGIDRETVGKYVREGTSKPAIPPTGSEPEVSSKPAILPAGSESGLCLEVALAPVGPEELERPKPAIVPTGSPRGRRSQCEPWRPRIEAGLEAGLTAQRIYQDLAREHGYGGGYDAVKRFVRRLLQRTDPPFQRIEVEPGAEAQVDFGQGAWVIENGKRRRPHLFRIVLSHSRKAYSEVVWRQSTENFIRALENAFRHFGGVPQTLVIDNLRAAVKRTDWFEPELNPKVEEFCRHYGTVILPTRPAMPHHKGKVEAGVKYAQNNALKGRQFESLSAQNLFLADWEQTVADTRIHGTTRQQVGRIFGQIEQPRLLALPAGLFPVFEEAPRSVHRDGHIELQRAYYSVPPEYVGRQVWVRWEAKLVRVFNQRRELIALHARVEPGKFATDVHHLHSPHRRGVQRSLEYLLDEARALGPHTGSWAQAMVQQRGPAGMRLLHGLLSLAGKHPVAALERAAQKALHHGAWRLRDLRTLLEQAGPAPQLDFLETHPLIRPLSDYDALAPDCFASSPSTPSPAYEQP
jgi:transposase